MPRLAMMTNSFRGIARKGQRHTETHTHTDIHTHRHKHTHTPHNTNTQHTLADFGASSILKKHTHKRPATKENPLQLTQVHHRRIRFSDDLKEHVSVAQHPRHLLPRVPLQLHQQLVNGHRLVNGPQRVAVGSYRQQVPVPQAPERLPEKVGPEVHLPGFPQNFHTKI